MIVTEIKQNLHHSVSKSFFFLSMHVCYAKLSPTDKGGNWKCAKSNEKKLRYTYQMGSSEFFTIGLSDAFL